MQARVEAYQQDFDRTLNDKIETIDKQLKTVDRSLSAPQATTSAIRRTGKKSLPSSSRTFRS